MTRTSDLRNLILKAKHAYYYSNEPIMSDAEYDALEDKLRQLAPDDPILALVGAPVPGDTMLTKARHSIPMGSQNKVNSEAEFMTWAARWPGSAIHASLKGDGASAAAYYEDGRLVQAISRGDGVIGEDITANALRFKGLPAWAGDGSGGFSGAVRFEVILTVEDWGYIDPTRSKNPRNAGTGIMGRKNGHQSDYLTIFVFDLDETLAGQSVAFASESTKLARLAELGFNVISHQHCDTPDEAIAYFRRIAAERDTLPIWIDGVVMKFDDLSAQAELGVTSGRPKGQVAWKFDSVGMETVLEGVVVSGGHTGALNPTAQLRPVEIGGTTVSNASLANYDEIARLDVAIGDSVWVVKANDIIPKIIRVTQRPEGRIPIVPPDICPFCSGEVGRRSTHDGSDGVIVECRNPLCPKKSSGKIKRWIASLDILGIGDSVLEAMLDTFELEDAAGLYTLRERQAELAHLIINSEKGISLGEKRATSILDAIDVTRNLTLSQFLGSLGLDHLGKRRVHLMMVAAQGQLDTLDDWRNGKLRNPAIAESASVPNIGSQIQDGIDSMASVIDKLLAAGVTVLPPENDIQASEDILMKTVCISGKLHSGKKKADYAESLRAIGFELVDEVSKGLDFLVLADPNSASSKAEKARKLGIEVISEEILEQLIAKGHDTQAPAKKEPPLEAVSVPVTAMKKSVPPKQEKVVAERLASASFDGTYRRFEFTDEKSSKFWSIRVSGNEVEVKYGRIGTEGQSQVKAFDNPEAAEKHAGKLIAEKMGKGYVEVGCADISKTVANISEGTVPQAEIPLQVLPGNIAAKKTPTKHRKVRSASALAKDPTTESARLELLLGKTKSISSLLVKHPNASAALLEKLSHSFDSTIRQQVVLHANTSKDVLLRLADIFPEDIIRSPVFDRLLLEESDQLLTRIGGRLATILERHDCPPSLMNWAVKHGSRYERLVVAKNPATPVELLNYLAANDGEIGLCGPISFERAKAILLAEIKRQIKSDNNIGSYRYRYKEYAWSPDHPFEVRQAIMFRENDARSLVLEILKVNFEGIISRCKAEQLEKIIDDNNWGTDKLVIPALINHPELTKEMLTKILDERIGWPDYEEDDMHQECIRAILGHPFCPVEYIKNNSDDDYWGTIASNSSIKLEWLEKYVTENSCWLHAVRGGENLALGAAENTNCSAKLLQSIINWRWGEDCEPCDANGRVRLAIINHPNCSDKLKKLLIEELCNSGHDYLILKLLSVHGLPDSMQEKAVEEIQKSKNVEILLNFASMSCCPEELRHDLLLKHASNHEYCELISNILTKYPDNDVWRDAIDTLLVTGDMNSLVAIADSYIRSKDIFDRVVLDAPDEVRRKLAANPSCPLDVIEKLTNDTNPIIQLIAACNANASYGLWLKYAFPYLVEPVSNWPIVKWSLANDLPGAENFDQFERDLYLPEKYANVIMKDDPRPLRLLALLGNGVTKQQLLCYGKSMGSEDSWMFRSVVALNKTTDIEILNLLANDEDLIVKTLALAAIDARAVALEQHN